MSTAERGAREVALPAPAFAALRRALRDRAGGLAAIHDLHAAGYRAGESMYDAFVRTLPGPAEEVPEWRFWSLLSRFFDRRGWGTLAHSAPHPGVGLLSSRDWAESSAEDGPRPACAFSTGLLAHLLTRAAGAPVAVLEVSCRSRGDDACAFAFGADTTIHDLYGLLLEGSGMDHALAEL